MPYFRWAICASLVLLAATPLCLGQDRDTRVKNDRERFEGDTTWIYNDLPQGLQKAKQTGMPLLVVIRCIP